MSLAPLREEQLELTTRKILSAVVDLVAEGCVSEFSVPLVAERSGVSVATIYRHFPTKAGTAWSEQSLAREGIDPETAEGQRLERLGLLLTSSLAFLERTTGKGSCGMTRSMTSRGLSVH